MKLNLKNLNLYTRLFIDLLWNSFAISNILPCIFNVKPFNFFFATLIGTLPQIFLVCSLGSGIEKIIDQNIEAPSLIELLSSPDIYIPLAIFVVLLIITIFLRKIFYK